MIAEIITRPFLSSSRQCSKNLLFDEGREKSGFVMGKVVRDVIRSPSFRVEEESFRHGTVHYRSLLRR